MQCMPGTILRSFEEDERAMVPGLWFMTDAAGTALSRVASPGFVTSPPSPVHPWSSPRWRSAIWHRGLAPSRVGTDPAGTRPQHRSDDRRHWPHRLHAVCHHQSRLDTPGA